MLRLCVYISLLFVCTGQGLRLTESQGRHPLEPGVSEIFSGNVSTGVRPAQAIMFIPNFDEAWIQQGLTFFETKVWSNRFLKKLIIDVPIILLLIFFERIIPFKRIPFFRRGFFSDVVWYSIAQDQILQLLIINNLMALPLVHHFDLISKMPIWQQALIILVLFDFVTYWIHRLFHSSSLWRFHELHHSTLELDCISGLRHHPVDVIFAAAANSVIFCLTGANFQAAEIAAVVVMLHGFYAHANFRNRIGWLQYIFISTEMHRSHHLREIKYQQANYGTVLSIWDWLFGTAYYPREKEYENVPFGTDSTYPQNFLKANIHVFRKMD